MIKNYFKTSVRNLVKNKATSFINIGGLSVGIAVAVLISLWIYDELSFNKQHKNYNRIAQVLQNQHISGGIETFESLPMALTKVLRENHGNDLEEVAATVRFDQFVAYNNKVFSRRGMFTEPQLVNILLPEMISGNVKSINDPSSILLSESLAKTLFGSENPINKQVKVGNAFELQVTGVYKDFLQNSEFNDAAFIAPISQLVKNDFVYDNWKSSFAQVYVLVKEHSNAATVSSKIKNVLYENSQDASKPLLFLSPMSKWHLYEYKNGEEVAGRLQFVWLFGIIDALVLLLAAINFINLSTARSGKRAKEVGIRKTIGSMRSQLIYQFFCECFFTVILSAMLATLLVALSINWFGELSGKQLSVPVNQPGFWLIGLGFILLMVLLSGSYPALYLSSFKPIQVLKGVFQSGARAGISRKVLVVTQFTVSVSLIIGTIQVYRQIQFAKNRPTGYDRDRLLTIQMNNSEIFNKYESFKNELLNTQFVENISRSSSSTTTISSSANNLDWKGKDPNVQATFGTILVDPEYGNLVKWKLAEGRNFSNQLLTDSFGFIFNESAIKMMGLKNPIGETVKWHDKNWQIIGVAKDMVMTSPFDKSKPTVFLMNDKERNFNVIHVKLINAKAASESLKNIETVFKKYCPAAPFEYKFADEAYATKFASEERIGKLATLFSSLAIFISCLGLFGLASYVAEQRTKEVGIRKVLGATTMNLWGLLSKGFVWLVIISCVIAVPITSYILQQWLQNYEYHTTIEWWVFAVAIIGALLITLLTVSFQAIKAAVTNPVKSLRTE